MGNCGRSRRSRQTCLVDDGAHGGGGEIMGDTMGHHGHTMKIVSGEIMESCGSSPG